MFRQEPIFRHNEFIDQLNHLRFQCFSLLIGLQLALIAGLPNFASVQGHQVTALAPAAIGRAQKK